MVELVIAIGIIRRGIVYLVGKILDLYVIAYKS